MPNDPTDKPAEVQPPRWIPCPTCDGSGTLRAADMSAAAPAGGVFSERSRRLYQEYRAALVAQAQPAPAESLLSLRGMARGATGGRSSEEVVDASREGWAAEAQPAPAVPSDAEILARYDQEIRAGGSADSVIIRTARALLARYGSQGAALLHAALVEVREMVQEWANYASAYFQEKHDLAGELAKLDAAIAASQPPADGKTT